MEDVRESIDHYRQVEQAQYTCDELERYVNYLLLQGLTHGQTDLYKEDKDRKKEVFYPSAYSEGSVRTHQIHIYRGIFIVI